jgi:hypothetical protein
MAASDAFSEYYTELLRGTYDCVDRIVLNGLLSIRSDRGRHPQLVAMAAR